MITINEFTSKLKNEFDEIEADVLTPEMRLEEALELSSLNMLLLMAFLKTEFDLNASSKSIASCDTITELHALVTEGQEK